MKLLLAFHFLLFFVCLTYAENLSYQSLDATDPILFGGDFIQYKGVGIQLGPKTFFVDGQLSDAEAALYPFVYNSVVEACKYITDGAENAPMVLYIAPYVYWIDNPDDPEVRKGKNGQGPFGLEIECEWLRFHGLSEHPENVVLACNRGQTIGAIGNFTMFKILGNGISSENITFGNYCNVDLEFPLKPELGREKRASAIVQAQLIICNGDKIVARNTRFISRLNLCPFVGAKRILFDSCHFESTDDALCGTGVYLNSTFDFYSSKPFYATYGTGAVFLNCDIHTMAGGQQYFTKANGQLALIDTRITSDQTTYVGWNDVTPPETRNYQSNISMNGQSLLIGARDSNSTIDLQGKGVLEAYRLAYKGKTVYNVYNLLCGNDDWDPGNTKELVLTAEKMNHTKYSHLPVQLKIKPTRVFAVTGKDSIVISAQAFRFGNFPEKETISWKVAKEYEDVVRLNPFFDGSSCTLIPINQKNETVQVVVQASTSSGLEAASVITVSPKRLKAPDFSELPFLTKSNGGSLSVHYALNTEFEDQSLVSWYRCADADGTNPFEVAVSRLNVPCQEYTLRIGDVGYYIMVEVAPKHLRCDAGAPERFILANPIMANDVKTDANILKTDFKNISLRNQLDLIPGFWTFRPLPTERDGQIIPVDNEKDAWYYGEGSQGNANRYGLLQTGRSATMLNTPMKKSYGDMALDLTVSPYKTAGQGFSVAHLYMDVLIKFDTKTMSGYALRFIRTIKYGNAVDVYFVKYDKGTATQIDEAHTFGGYRSPCHIQLSVKGNKLIANVSTSSDYTPDPTSPEILHEVDIQTNIESNTFGGFGIQYNGGSSAMINELEVHWE
ncbi:MAG: hypothetical protein ACERKD_09390 [Prolixibacteraceae bacterium]